MTALLLVTFAAFVTSAALGLAQVDNCTGGSADALHLGIFSLPLYLVAIGAAILRPLSRRLAWLLLPALAMGLWHGWFALNLAWNYWMHGISACFTLLGRFPPEEAGEWMDGSEAALALLWIGLAGLNIAAVALAARGGSERNRIDGG